MRYEIQMTLEFLTDLFNIPEGYKISDVRNNFGTLKLIICEDTDITETYQLKESGARMVVSKTESCSHRDLISWKDWDIHTRSTRTS